MTSVMEGLQSIADKGESPAITTEDGLKCLATIRKTADKSGRIICTMFESLPPRDSKNEGYYKRTRLPISLETIEAKLKAFKYNTMTEVESDLKRMVQNVKESHYKKSQAFEDAERVRKAVSNYMVRHNPAYLDRTYSAFPTPLPPSEDEEMADASDSAESTNGDEMDVDDDANEKPKTSGKSRGRKGKNESEDESGDESEDQENEDDKEDDDEEDEKPDPAPMPPITPARRRGRPPRSASATAVAAATASVAMGTRHSTRTPNKTSASSTPTPSNVKKSEEELLSLTSYKGLTFQEAQEKIVEELLHREEDGYDGPYYEAFINLPPRELKDYYQVISEPLSLRKLKKHVQGFQTKKLITGVTQFRTWKAFEEKASLLWSNAYYYNEEGSEIYDIAKDLEAFFKKHLKEAKTHTIEPTPSTSATKVILKSRTPTAVPPSKIILHASRNRRDYTPESPAVVAKKAKDDHRVSSTSVPTRERTKAKTITPAPPSSEDSDEESEDESGDDEEMEDADADADGDADDSDKEVEDEAEAEAEAEDEDEDEAEAEAEVQPEIQEPPVKKLKPVALTRYPGKTKANANLQRVAFQTINMHHKPHQLIISAHNTEMRQHHSYHLDGTFLNQKMRIVPKTLPGLFKNRYVRLYITADKVPLEPSNSNEQPNEHYFETILHRGVNTMEVHCIAGPPEGSELPDGARYEVEVMAASFNVYTGY